MSDRSLEEPVADSLEQHQEVIPGPDEAGELDLDESARSESAPSESASSQVPGVPLEADEADVAEQARGLDLPEDDYR